MAPERKASGPAGGDLRTRVASALVLAPIALAAGIAGGIPFAALAAAVAAIGFWEWTGMTAAAPMPLRIAGIAMLALSLLGLVVVPSGWPILLIVVAGAVAVPAGIRSKAAGWSGFGILYTGLACAAFIALREAEPNGWAAMLFILAVVWTTDTAAYFGGRALGGPKLWPSVSPKKTWSGALSGLLAALLVGAVVAKFTGAATLGTGLLLAGPLSVASQAGDLFESAVKRRCGVKDSGHLIPGHGGVLDRVDGLLAAGALAWLFAVLGLGGQLLALPRHLSLLPATPP